MSHSSTFSELPRILDTCSQLIVFTGAGISTESGIPDFRSPGGIWSQRRPVTYQDFITSEDARRDYWSFKKQTYSMMAAARPNAGHLAIAQLEKSGRLQVLITQNIDGLHEKAGNSSDRVLELHGNDHRVSCLQCGAMYQRSIVQEWLEGGEEIPSCRSCRGLLKPATVSFGQALPQDILDRALAESERCSAFLVVGSSLVVQPAATLPQVAKANGAWLGILNREPTPLDHMADWHCREPSGEVLSRWFGK